MASSRNTSASNMDAKYKSIIQTQNLESLFATANDDFDMLDQLLEKEKQHNTTKPWTKLENTLKIQKLHAFAEKYSNDHNLTVKDCKLLKQFLSQSVYDHKLQKTKEVIYNKETREVVSVPILQFSAETQQFYLKDVDTGKGNTIKSLTPKRVSEKNMSELGL